MSSELKSFHRKAVGYVQYYGVLLTSVESLLIGTRRSILKLLNSNTLVKYFFFLSQLENRTNYEYVTFIIQYSWSRKKEFVNEENEISINKYREILSCFETDSR